MITLLVVVIGLLLLALVYSLRMGSLALPILLVATREVPRILRISILPWIPLILSIGCALWQHNFWIVAIGLVLVPVAAVIIFIGAFLVYHG